MSTYYNGQSVSKSSGVETYVKLAKVLFLGEDFKKVGFENLGKFSWGVSAIAGVKYVEYDGISIYDQNKNKTTKYAELANSGVSLAWGMTDKHAGCDKCNGTGKYTKDDTKPCFACHGTGVKSDRTYSGVCVWVVDGTIFVGDKYELNRVFNLFPVTANLVG